MKRRQERSRLLQEHRHVERDVADVVLGHDVFCVEDVGVAEAVPELAPEFVERGVMLVGAAFDLEPRRGMADDARAYNALVMSWSEIELAKEESARSGRGKLVQGELL